MGTHRLATHGEEVIMKFFAVLASVLSAAAGEASLPIAAHHLATAGLYSGYHGIAAPYAAAYGQDARFAYGAPVTALNAGPLTAGPVAEAPVAAAVPALTAAAPVVGAQYAAAYAAPAIAAPAIAAPAYAAPAIAAPAIAAPANAAPAYAAPVAAAAPAVAAAPVAASTSSQFQAQDEFGNLAYGYQNVNSAKQERGNTYGGVEGSYTYVDEAGVHTVNYVADDLGFRVVGDNLPVAPVHNAVAPVAPVYTGVAPVAVVDTPEVAEAKAAFHAAYAAEASRTKRSAQFPAGIINPAAYAAVAPAAVAAAPAAPSREAILTTIKLNPGHAVFYRVD